MERIREIPWRNQIAGTLTLKQSIRLPEGNYEKGSPTRYEQNARFFFNTLNRALYGNGKVEMRAVSVLEKETAIRQGWMERIREIPWRNQIAGTLTLKQSIRLPEGNYEKGSPTRYEQNARFFFNTLNRALYGNGKVEMRAVSVLEKSDRYHDHMLFERPSNVSNSEFEWLVRLSWALSDWGYDQVDIKQADDGWLGYMFKGSSKEGIYSDSVVVGACYLNSSAPAARPLKPQLRKLRLELLRKMWSSPYPCSCPNFPGLAEFLSEDECKTEDIYSEGLSVEPEGVEAFSQARPSRLILGEWRA